jgi:hypothetical protein
MKALFPGALPGTFISDLKNKFYANLPLLKKVLYGELTRKKYFLSSPEKVRNSYMAAGIVVLVFAVLAFLFLVPDSGGKSFIAGIFDGNSGSCLRQVHACKNKSGGLRLYGYSGS